MSDWKIGLHGGTLNIIRSPGTPTFELVSIGAAQQSLQGGQTQDTFAKKYSITWTWSGLGQDDYADLVVWWDGTNGDGPFDVIDPAIRTALITVNVQSFAPNPGPYLGLWSPEMVMVEV